MPPALRSQKTDDWMHEVLEVPKERFNSPEAIGKPQPKPPTASEKVGLVLASAASLIKQAQDKYRETKAGTAQSTFATGLDDPIAKIQEQTAHATKTAADATAALKHGDTAKAAKLADEAEAAGRKAYDLATNYAVAFDHAGATQTSQVTNTPWGSITMPVEKSTDLERFIVPLTKAIEADKTLLDKIQAASAEQKAAVTPLLPYLTAPEKAAAEISTFASTMSVIWAENSSTAKLLEQFMGHYKKTLEATLKQAYASLTSAQKRIKSLDLTQEAQEKREAAERINKIIDTIVDFVVGGIKLIAAGPELAAAEAIGIAADIVGGMIKTFKSSDLLKQAGELEAQAKLLQHEAVTIDLQSAAQAIHDLDSQLTTLSPLAGHAGEDAERKIIRSVKQYDTDSAKDPRAKGSKFRFALVTMAQTATKHAQDAATQRSRWWMGMEANRGLLVQQIEKYGYWFGDNSKTVEAAKSAIAKSIAESNSKIGEMNGIAERLDMLFASALEALTNAKVGKT